MSLIASITVGCNRDSHNRESAGARTSAPRVESLSPLGVQRGVEETLELRGPGLSGITNLVAPFSFTWDRSRPEAVRDGVVRLHLRVDAATPPGVYPVRLRTDEGLSEPFPLAIDSLPRVLVAEGAHDSDKNALRISLPTIIEGTLGEKLVGFDCVFRGRAGQKIVIEPMCARIGSGIDATVNIASPDRQFLAMNEYPIQRLADLPAFVELPGDGDYFVFMVAAPTQYIKKGRRIYRIRIGELTEPAEVYPLGARAGQDVGIELRGGSLAKDRRIMGALRPKLGLSSASLEFPDGIDMKGRELDQVQCLPPLEVDTLPGYLEAASANGEPQEIELPAIINGRIGELSEVDRYRLKVSPGQRLGVEVMAHRLGSSLRATLEMRDSRDALVASVHALATDEEGAGINFERVDPAFEYLCPPGQKELTLSIKDVRKDSPGHPQTGGIGYAYRIRVMILNPSIDLWLDEGQVNVPRGGTATVGVKVVRKGYDGPLTMRLGELPSGVTAQSNDIAAGQTRGSIVFSSTPDADRTPLLVDLIAEARGNDGPIVRKGRKVLAFGDLTTNPTKVVVDRYDDKVTYMEWPARLRTRIITQQGLFVTTSRGNSKPGGADEGPGKAGGGR